MNPIVNFYLVSEGQEDSFEELAVGIKADNTMYLTLQTQDIIVLPNSDGTQYRVSKIVKDFSSGEMDVYLSKAKVVEELFEEIGAFANETLRNMFGSIKINVLDSDVEKEDKQFLKEVIYEEEQEDKLN